MNIEHTEPWVIYYNHSSHELLCGGSKFAEKKGFKYLGEYGDFWQAYNELVKRSDEIHDLLDAPKSGDIIPETKTVREHKMIRFTFKGYNDNNIN